MKKVLAVLFMALAFSMTACGNSGENSDSQSSGYEETGTDSDTAAASTTAAESSAQSSESSGTSAGTTSGTAAAREAIPASEAFHQKSIWFGISDDRSFAKADFDWKSSILSCGRFGPAMHGFMEDRSNSTILL